MRVFSGSLAVVALLALSVGTVYAEPLDGLPSETEPVLLADGGDPQPEQIEPQPSTVAASTEIYESEESARKGDNVPHEVHSPHFKLHWTPYGLKGRWEPQLILGATEQTYRYATETAGFGEVDDLPFEIFLASFDFYPRLQGKALGFVNDESALVLDRDMEFEEGAVAHETFHLFQRLFGDEHNFITEATANVVGYKVSDDFSHSRPYFTYAPSTSLDCTGDPNSNACHGDPSGYGRWPFYWYLTQTYGDTVLSEIYHELGDLSTQRSLSARDRALRALDNVLRRHESSLSSAFVDFTNFNLTNRYDGNATDQYEAPHVTTALLSERRRSESIGLAVDHLAARYLTVGQPQVGNCTDGTLKVVAAFPLDTFARPTLNSNGSDTALEIKPGPFGMRAKAKATVPWSTCQSGYLGLANGSLTHDGAWFTTRARFKPSR